ncbi:MAG: helix-turn-helix transcriptional regulator [Arthrobacter sp.]|nr:helix-turn-helix transcriptional regulator [Arthrobacter sp.]MDZ4351348.1 helix-turn-helix transcriptional regulator [Arthrobacter sp.]
MAGQKIELGPTGRTVADNIKRVRGARSINYADLSRKLGELGRSISPLAVRRIEEGERRVDSDDLMAISVALGVPPNSLLLPHSDPSPAAAATALAGVKFQDLWVWADGNGPLRGEETAAEGAQVRELARPVLLSGAGGPDVADLTARMLAALQEAAALSYELKTQGALSGDD